MGNNASVQQFRKSMADLAGSMNAAFHDTLLAQADELVGNIKAAIQHSVSGELKASVRKQDVSTADGTKLSILIRAGGELTTKRSAEGHRFDYALAEEFGTSKEDPRPFFYSTVRFYRNFCLEQFRETFEETIAENNKVRALASSNYNNNGFTVVGRGPFKYVAQTNTMISYGYRGAIVIQNRAK